MEHHFNRKESKFSKFKSGGPLISFPGMIMVEIFKQNSFSVLFSKSQNSQTFKLSFFTSRVLTKVAVFICKQIQSKKERKSMNHFRLKLVQEFANRQKEKRKNSKLILFPYFFQ